MTTSATRHADLRLESRPDAPGRARDFFVARCEMWAVPQLLEAGTLVVSELVTNAVRHAGTDILVALFLGDAALTVSVFDRGQGVPRIVPPDQRSLGGRGLAMVEKLAECWGVRIGSGGKAVWCRMSVRPLAA